MNFNPHQTKSCKTVGYTVLGWSTMRKASSRRIRQEDTINGILYLLSDH